MGEPGGGGHSRPPPPPTFLKIVLCQGCFPGNSLLCHSPRHPKLFWPRHSQNLVGDPELWESLETANKEQDSSVSMNDLIRFVTQSIIIVGQTNIALSYHRRLRGLDDVL